MKWLSQLENKRILTFILAGGRGERLYPLTKERSKPSVPIAGSYRIIDFALSNCINSGLRNIFLLTQTKSQSLDIHVRTGWNFLSAPLGEFISTIPAQQRMGEQWYQGSADAIYQNLHVIQDYKPDLILILSGDHIYRMNYLQMLAHHVYAGADVTLPVMPIPKTEAHAFGVLETDSGGRIRNFVEKPKTVAETPGEGDFCHINMGIYLFDTKTLVRAVAEDANQNTAHDFGRDILPALVKTHRVMAMPFEKNTLGGYWRDVGTLDSYYQATMDLLSGEVSPMLYDTHWPIHAVGGPGSPNRFDDQGSTLSNSIIGHNCHLAGATITHSVLGSGVRVAPGAIIENAIIFDDCVIEAGAVIRNAILDKNVTVPAQTQVGAEGNSDQAFFTVSPKGITVVPKSFMF